MAELQYGIKKSSKPAQNKLALNQFLTPLEIVDFDFDAARELRAALEKEGTPIGALDTLIAAHTKSLGSVLVTNNVREFDRVDGLEIENWIKT